MTNVEFEEIKTNFKSASLEEKIDIYISAEGLTQEQYRDLLSMYPVSEIHRLEAALTGR